MCCYKREKGSKTNREKRRRRALPGNERRASPNLFFAAAADIADRATSSWPLPLGATYRLRRREPSRLLYLRPYERNPLEPNGRGKWQKTGPSITQQNQLKVPPGAIIFRVLCPASKSGSVIGKGGGIVARIRQETGAKIRLEETVPGCDERVIVVTGLEKDAELGNEQSKEDDEETGTDDGGDNSQEITENIEGTKDSSPVESSKFDGVPSSVVKALLLVFERIIEGEAENDDEDEANKKLSNVSARLLVLSNQVGCLLGKGGSVIKQMSADSGAQIRILPRDKLPL
ncbi:hypothetical protein BHE74_00004722 [Ensete ventricosum]|nr:hypothetical protein GW17_00042612 [Ensete ventricosum]RWW86498.1 hypothetical protein BHE74_00004722 [Ensete ventricosum]RZR76897.1 hypothetical protein BHM03_00001797 [Ensete ventricosum]